MSYPRLERYSNDLRVSPDTSRDTHKGDRRMLQLVGERLCILILTLKRV
jgi:hypothetical protein